MDSHENIALIRKYIEERWNRRKLSLIDELVSADFILHTPSGDIDLATFKEAIRSYLESFPDSHVVIEDVLADGNRVAMRYAFSGTHSAEFMGIKATGKRTLCSGMAFYRIADERIAKGWFVEDTLGLLQQLGAGR